MWNGQEKRLVFVFRLTYFILFPLIQYKRTCATSTFIHSNWLYFESNWISIKIFFLLPLQFCKWRHYIFLALLLFLCRLSEIMPEHKRNCQYFWHWTYWVSESNRTANTPNLPLIKCITIASFRFLLTVVCLRVLFYRCCSCSSTRFICRLTRVHLEPYL